MNMLKNRKLFSNFISLSIVQGINFLVPLLVMPYVISKVGAAGFGVIAVAQVLMIYLSTIADYGFNLTATKEIALHKDDRQKISRIFFTVLTSKLLITLVLLIFLLSLSLFVPLLKQHFILYSLGFTYVIGQSLFVNWLFQGIEKMQYITLCSLLSRLVFFVLVFVFIQHENDGKYFMFFLGLGNLVAGLLSIIMAIKILKLKFILPKKEAIFYEIKEGWQITVSNLSINTFLYSGIFILRIFTNDMIVGYYSIAERIFFAVRQVLAVFSQAIYPQVCLLKQKGEAAGRSFFKEVFRLFLLVTIVGAVLLFIIAPQAIHFFIKDGATLPVFLLRMLCVVPVIVCLNIPAYQLLLAFDPAKSYLRVYVAATLINIIANIILVNTWAATGTVVSIIITETFISVGLNRQLVKNGLSGFLSANMASAFEKQSQFLKQEKK